MKRIFLLLIIFISTLSYAPPKVDKQQSSLDLVEKNYNKFAYASGALLATSAALNYDKIMLHLHSYYIQYRPYLNQANLGRASLLSGAVLAMPLLYLKYKKSDK